MTSVTNIKPTQGACCICGETGMMKIRDRELEAFGGLVCNDCTEPLVVAEHVLLKTRGITRPES